jgi:hypothetical protein
LIVSSGADLYALQVTPSAIKVLGHKIMPSPVSCMDIYTNPISTIFGFLFVGQWLTNSFTIFRVELQKKTIEFVEIQTTQSPVDSVPHSIRVVTQNTRTFMIGGLKDGHVVIYEFDTSRGFLSEKYQFVKIGTTAVELVPFYDTQHKSKKLCIL